MPSLQQQIDDLKRRMDVADLMRIDFHKILANRRDFLPLTQGGALA